MGPVRSRLRRKGMEARGNGGVRKWPRKAKKEILNGY